MIRTQVYLSEQEQKGLKSLAKRLGKRQSELIRLAVDQMIDSHQPESRLSFRRVACGLWKHREDVSPEKLRQGWDRKYGGR